MSLYELEAFKITNDLRNFCGIPSLLGHPVLQAKAQRWAEHLADLGHLEHSNLADGAPPRWVLLGENVGTGGSIQSIFDAYYRSPKHIGNILERRFTHHGIAVVERGGALFTASEFAQFGALSRVRRRTR